MGGTNMQATREKKEKKRKVQCVSEQIYKND